MPDDAGLKLTEVPFTGWKKGGGPGTPAYDNLMEGFAQLADELAEEAKAEEAKAAAQEKIRPTPVWVWAALVLGGLALLVAWWAAAFGVALAADYLWRLTYR